MKPHIAVNYDIAEGFKGKLEKKYSLVSIQSPSSQVQPSRREDIRALVTGASVPTGLGVLELLPNLSLIAVFGSGLDRLDPLLMCNSNVKVVNTPQVNAGAVSEYVVAQVLALTNELSIGDHYLKAGLWYATQKRLPLRRGLAGRRIGIVGLGAIGSKVAALLSGFSVSIGYHNRSPRADQTWSYFSSVIELACWADVLIVCARASGSGPPLVDDLAIQALGPDGYLVNVARSSLIDEQAAIRALSAGELAGLALDVFSQEPIDGSDFGGFYNAILTPHMAGATISAHEAMADGVVATLDEFYLALKQTSHPAALTN